jgi:hypothetical protein
MSSLKPLSGIRDFHDKTLLHNTVLQGLYAQPFPRLGQTGVTLISDHVQLLSISGTGF